jgi:membrane protein DedA with SNARE-associated domain
MLDMHPAAFYAVNVLSAFGWAPAYLLPGMAFGAALALADVVAARLAVLLALFGALTWLVLWFIRVVVLGGLGGRRLGGSPGGVLLMRDK